MPNTYQLVSMTLNPTKSISFNVRSDIISYFAIPVASTTPTKITRTIAAYTRYINSGGLTDQQKKEVTVGQNVFDDVVGRPRKNRGGNKNIRVPSKLKATKGTLRYCTIRIPRIATNYTIALWIKENFSANAPLYFLTDAGRKYPVNVPASANPNAVLAGTAIGGTTGGGAALPPAP